MESEENDNNSPQFVLSVNVENINTSLNETEMHKTIHEGDKVTGDCETETIDKVEMQNKPPGHSSISLQAGKPTEEDLSSSDISDIHSQEGELLSLAVINTDLEKCRILDYDDDSSDDVEKLVRRHATHLGHQKVINRRKMGKNKKDKITKTASQPVCKTSEIFEQNDLFKAGQGQLSTNNDDETKGDMKKINFENNKVSCEDKTVKFNPQVQVIRFARKKIGTSEIVINSYEILNKENDQQARNYRMRKSYSLTKLNSFYY